MEKKLETLLRDFEYQAREMVNAVQDRAASQKLSKDAERRISKLRREFSEQFDSTVVAHTTGADRGDPNAQPQVVKHVSEGDTVKLKSVGRPAVVSRRIDENHFEVEIGAMKMKIARDDIAEVLSRAADSPVKAAGRAEFRCRWRRKTTACRQKSTSSAAPWTTPLAKWRNSWTAHSWPDCRECAWCTAAAWEFCGKRCGSICRSIRTWNR